MVVPMLPTLARIFLATTWTDKTSAIAGSFAAAAAVVGLGLVVGGLIYARRQLDDATRTRHSELLVALWGQWATAQIEEAMLLHARLGTQKVREVVIKAFHDPRNRRNAALYYKLKRVPEFFELVGVLYRHRESLTIDAINLVWGDAIPQVWYIWSPTIHEITETSKERGFDIDEKELWGNMRTLVEGIEALEREAESQPASPA